MSYHAVYSPSSAHRWMRCAAAPNFAARFPNETSEAAEDGIQAHEYAAWLLQEPTEPESAQHAIWKAACPSTIPSDWAAPIQEYVDYCRALELDVPMVEQVVPISHITGEDGATGTSDFCGIKGRTLHVVDLKFGLGDLVFARDESEDGVGVNPQVLMYASGVAVTFDFLGDFDDVTLHIVQPRRDHVDTLTLTREEFEEAVNRLTTIRNIQRGGVAPFVPGAIQCKWCPGRAHCEERRQWHASAFERDLGNIPDSDLPDLLARCGDMRKFADDIEARAFNTIKGGRDVRGWKVVEGRSTRKWLPEAEAQLPKLLGEKAYKPRVIIGITAAEKLLKKTHDIFKTLTSKAPGNPKLVPEGDKRPALKLAATDDFQRETSNDQE